MTASSLKIYAAETVGTFLLVLVGTGAIVLNDATNGLVTHAGIALAFGGIVTAMIYAFGATSGAHINPAVTIAFWLSGRFEGRLVLPYCLAQLVGALLASGLLWMLWPSHETLGSTLPTAGVWPAFGLEIGLTFLLMLVILHISSSQPNIAKWTAIAVGTVVMLEALFAGPLTGASMNPARSIGPAVWAFQLVHLWIYLAAPIVGAVLAIPACRQVKGAACCPGPGGCEQIVEQTPSS